MKYYFVFPNACCDFDAQTLFHYLDKRLIGATNMGLVFDRWPLDDLFSCFPGLFCTERLKFLLETNYQKFTGMEFDSVERISTACNWNDNCESNYMALPPKIAGLLK